MEQLGNFELEPRRGQVYLVAGAESFGSELRGTRPGVIVSNDEGNRSGPVVEVVFLTSRPKKPMATHVPVHVDGRDGMALSEQISTVDKRRLLTYMGTLTEQEQERLDQAMEASLHLHCSRGRNVEITTPLGRRELQLDPERIRRLLHTADRLEENRGSRESCPAEGYLIVECSGCGKVRAFRARYPVGTYRCTCGASFSMPDHLRPAMGVCSCGRRLAYRTNAEQKEFSAPCPSCGKSLQYRLEEDGRSYSGRTEDQ